MLYDTIADAETVRRATKTWRGRAALDSAPGGEHAAVVRGSLRTVLSGGALLLGLLATSVLQAQIPTVFRDKVYRGSGTIDLLKDIPAANLQQYLSAGGGLLLGVDLNEDAAGNESRDSVGIAIKQLELVVTTSAGTFSFTDFYTSTTAMIREAGAASQQQYYTLFGKMGSSQLTGGTTGFDLGRLDDVIRLQNVSFAGNLLSARLNVTFLNTARTGTEGNETFFDFSDGFEDFALLSQQDAAVLEAANFGMDVAPSSIAYTETGPTVGPLSPGAPAPPLALLAAMGALVAWRSRRAKGDGKA